MRYVAVLPFVYAPFKDEFLKTCRFGDNLVLVDNTVNNRGIMRSNNIGIREMKARDADWFIICGASIRFGQAGGLDFIAELERRATHKVVEGWKVFGWHLIAFSREVVETIGQFDTSFSPYGYDDIDYSWRFQKAYWIDGTKQAIWEKTIVDVQDTMMAHGIKLAGVSPDNQALRAYFERKWGTTPEDPVGRWLHPFNDSSLSLKYFPANSGDEPWDAWDA